MDVSTAPHRNPDSALPAPAQGGGAASAPASAAHPPDMALPLNYQPAAMAFAPSQRRRPLRHAMAVGLGTMASVALTCCCLLSVSDLLWPSRKYLNVATLIISGLAGAYFGIQTWRKQTQPGLPVTRGRCLDCGRELFVGDDCCKLCGRKI